MSSDQTEMSGPDFARVVSLSLIPDGGMLAGRAEGKPVLLAREGNDVFAVGGQCTHYGGPLALGLVLDAAPITGAEDRAEFAGLGVGRGPGGAVRSKDRMGMLTGL